MYIEKAKWFFFQLVPATLFASSKWIGCIFWREHTTHLHIFVIITWCLVHSNWRQHSNHKLVFWILRLRKNRIEVKEILSHSMRRNGSKWQKHDSIQLKLSTERKTSRKVQHQPKYKSYEKTKDQTLQSNVIYCRFQESKLFSCASTFIISIFHIY